MIGDAADDHAGLAARKSCGAVTRVAVLGAGSWGTTVAAHLAARTPTTLWARSEAVVAEIGERNTNSSYLGDRPLPRALRATSSLAEALLGASLIVVAVPSHGVRDVLDAAAGLAGPGVPVLSLTKGLEQESLRRMSEVIGECWPDRSVGVLTGPNLATEVLDGQPTASVIALDDEQLARELQGLFATDAMRVYTNLDVVGCEIAGVVKNVMAIASGMAVGLGFGDNTRAALITRSLAELARLGVALGGDPLTFSGLAGLGDLVATCTSPKSRNFAVGVALGQGRSLDDALGATPMVAEGVRSSRPVVALAHRLGVEVPVAEQVVAVCFEGCPPEETIPRLMLRAAKSELHGIARG
ncbi:MAG TPA: NAD(P)H-dependent glycerol-3-phosphate dehydrogenase [Acidimicrobiales bacterium]|nr:NAD(P)H-dependent glycerol-3-phosphate dehydrogenase [Acidimicrobiales bacterium]